MIDLVLAHTIPAAMALLPPKMNSRAARAMLLAIGLQESRFMHRRQIGGPARGFWQFEIAGVRGVLHHAASKDFLSAALEQLRYPQVATTAQRSACHSVLEHNDVLACCCARLLLYTLPSVLPRQEDVDGAWAQYVEAWRPGKPHRPTWDAFYQDAWGLVGKVEE